MAYVPFTKLPQQFFDNLGNPLVNGTINAYLAGTSTPTNMFSDDTGTVAGTSVTLDSRGEPTTFKLIWLDSTKNYKFILKDSTGATIWTIDDISGAYPTDSNIVTYTPAGTGAVATTVQTKLRESISVKDFGAVGDGVTDDTAAIQAFFDYAQANKCFAMMEGTFLVSSAITSTGGAGSTFYLNASVTASVAMDWVIKFVNHSAVYFAGYLQIFGAGISNNYADRLCTDGIILEGCRGAKFEKLRVEKFLRHGVHVSATGNNTLLNLGDVRVHYCGSCGSIGNTVNVTYTNRSDTGSASSSSQRSVITLTTPDDVEVNQLVAIDGEPYLITAFNASSITVFPWTRTSGTTGTVQFYIGAGVKVSGDDAADVNFDSIDATSSASALDSASLYGAYAQRVVSQFCGVGVKIGNNTSSNYFGTKLDNFYTEGNVFDVVQTTTSNINSIIDNVYEFDYSKVFKLAPRDAIREYLGNLSVMTSLQVFGAGNSTETTAGQYGLGAYSTTYSIEAENKTTYIKGGNTISIQINHSASKDRAFGMNSQTFVVFGRRAGNRVDSVTFTTADAGATVMGGASYVITPVTTVLMITAWYDYENSNWVITKFVPV